MKEIIVTALTLLPKYIKALGLRNGLRYYRLALRVRYDPLFTLVWARRLELEAEAMDGGDPARACFLDFAGTLRANHESYLMGLPQKRLP